MHKRLEHIKDCLVCAIESQISHLEEVDAAELGEVVDMVKDLEEAIYYCTVTEAMKGQEFKGEEHYEMKNGEHYKDKRMYYGGVMYTEPEHESHYMMMDRDTMDGKEGRSHMSRRSYMEAKEMKKDKASQLRELEKYMQELSQDVVEMINDASPEEKQYLEKKISALAVKVGQMK